MHRAASWSLVCAAIVVTCLSACRAGSVEETPSPEPVSAPGGWSVAAEPQVYTQENLYDLVNGQADAFFAYGFQRVTVQQFERDGAVVTVEQWEVDSPANAYGLYSSSVAGAPIDLGNQGVEDAGRRLLFWQGQLNVHVHTRDPLTPEELREFGRDIARQLPSGGEAPESLGRLPENGRGSDPPLFFHEEISLQSALWLGGDNILGLGEHTDGVLAHYERGGEPLTLLVVSYPGTSEAMAALVALQGSPPEGLLTVRQQGELLGAVFGESATAKADGLLRETLQ